MSPLWRRGAVGLTLAAAAAAAQAQAPSVWRCGPEGRIYTDRPCPEGRSVDVADARPHADVQAAQSAAAGERRLAEALRQERVHREAQAQHGGAAGIGMPPRPVFKPLVPVTPPKKRRRAKEALAGADTSRAIAAASRSTPD